MHGCCGGVVGEVLQRGRVGGVAPWGLGAAARRQAGVAPRVHGRLQRGGGRVVQGRRHVAVGVGREQVPGPRPVQAPHGRRRGGAGRVLVVAVPEGGREVPRRHG